MANRYLKALGIDTSRAIKAVIATHWHDDHYKGLSLVLDSAPNASVWISSVLTNIEFFKFAERMRENRISVAGTKIDEFSKILDNIRIRKERGDLTFGFANARTQILRIDPRASGHGHPCEVVAISPSHGDLSEFLERLTEMMPKKKQAKLAVPSPSPNLASVATLVSVGPLSILLGADVENSGRRTAGWEAILSANQIQRFGPLASLYKVPHHGSETAHNRDVWGSLLATNPLCVLTPWRRGRGGLPTAAGAKAILQLSSNAYVTAVDARSRAGRGERPPGVQRYIREHQGIRLRSLSAHFGAIRLRS